MGFQQASSNKAFLRAQTKPEMNPDTFVKKVRVPSYLFNFSLRFRVLKREEREKIIIGTMIKCSNIS